jgi:hypothetical protein
MRQAGQFQEKVKQDIYDKFIVKEYNTNENGYRNISNVDGFNSNNTPVPTLDSYKDLSTSSILQQNRLDIALLCIYGLLFFTCAFVGFQRFDVR